MNYRLISFTVTDLILDPEGIAENLTESCRRPPRPSRITGVCQRGDTVSFPCEAAEGKPLRYVLAPVRGDSTEEFSADLYTRWVSGFTTLGIVQVNDSYLGLFSIPAE